MYLSLNLQIFNSFFYMKKYIACFYKAKFFFQLPFFPVIYFQIFHDKQLIIISSGCLTNCGRYYYFARQILQITQTRRPLLIFLIARITDFMKLYHLLCLTPLYMAKAIYYFKTVLHLTYTQHPNISVCVCVCMCVCVCVCVCVCDHFFIKHLSRI